MRQSKFRPMPGNDTKLQEIVEDATLDFALGEADAALRKLQDALLSHPNAFPVHLALAEIHFSRRELDEALEHAQRAAEIEPEDIHAHTSLSRIWMERGDKEKAESFGARARMLGWKEQLKEPPPPEVP